MRLPLWPQSPNVPCNNFFDLLENPNGRTNRIHRRYIGIPIEKGTLSLPWTPWRLSRFKIFKGSQLQQSAARKPGRGIVLPATVQPQEVAMMGTLMGTTWCFSMIFTFMMIHWFTMFHIASWIHVKEVDTFHLPLRTALSHTHLWRSCTRSHRTGAGKPQGHRLCIFKLHKDSQSLWLIVKDVSKAVVPSVLPSF